MVLYRICRSSSSFFGAEKGKMRKFPTAPDIRLCVRKEGRPPDSCRTLPLLLIFSIFAGIRRSSPESALIGSVREISHVTDEQITALMNDMFSRLPEHLRNYLVAV